MLHLALFYKVKQVIIHHFLSYFSPYPKYYNNIRSDFMGYHFDHFTLVSLLALQTTDNLLAESILSILYLFYFFLNLLVNLLTTHFNIWSILLQKPCLMQRHQMHLNEIALLYNSITHTYSNRPKRLMSVLTHSDKTNDCSVLSCHYTQQSQSSTRPQKLQLNASKIGSPENPLLYQP